MHKNNEPKFTCSQCDGRELIVSHVWNIEAGRESERWREWGPLKSDHHWHYEFKEKVEKNEDDEVQEGDFGEFAEEDSDSEPESYEIHEKQTERDEDEFFVNCANCDREIQFGWSLPDRRGLILPVESSDFSPAQCWPDPKYIDAWQKRGWLRTNTLQR